MSLSDILKKNNIIINPTAKNRWELIEEMLDFAIKNKEIKEADKEALKNALIERENSNSTGIGKGIAIPHCYTTKFDQTLIVLALSDEGIDFDSIDNLPVKIAIFLLAPKNKLTQHIKILANIAQIMNHQELRERILLLKNQEKIIKVIRDYEKNLQLR